MKHPCIELYFEVETEEAVIRIWLKTDNELVDGVPNMKYFHDLVELKERLYRLGVGVHTNEVAKFLEGQEEVSAFQVLSKYGRDKLSIVVYREW